MLGKIWSGAVPLPSLFWLYWLAPVTAAYLALSEWGSRLAFLRDTPGLVGFALALIGISTYSLICAVGIWRSAGAYAGRRLWRFGAKAGVLANLCWVALNLLLLVWGGAHLMFHADHDPGRIAEREALSSNAHPLAGFWKDDCAEQFGLAIAPAGIGVYSVSFCGPGGCFFPGTYRPDTRLHGDEAYRVIDDDTLDVHGRDGWTTYSRAGSRTGTSCPGR